MNPQERSFSRSPCILAQAVVCQHDVEYYRHGGGSREKYLVFLGLAANVEAAVLTHAYWCGAVEASYRGARQGNGSVLSAHDYKQGFAENILHRVRAVRREAANSPSIAALIRVGSEVARRALEAKRICLAGAFLFEPSAGEGSLPARLSRWRRRGSPRGADQPVVG